MAVAESQFYAVAFHADILYQALGQHVDSFLPNFFGGPLRQILRQDKAHIAFLGKKLIDFKTFLRTCHRNYEISLVLSSVTNFTQLQHTTQIVEYKRDAVL